MEENDDGNIQGQRSANTRISTPQVSCTDRGGERSQWQRSSTLSRFQNVFRKSVKKVDFCSTVIVNPSLMLFFQVSLILQFQHLGHLCHLCLQATRLTTS